MGGVKHLSINFSSTSSAAPNMDLRYNLKNNEKYKEKKNKIKLTSRLIIEALYGL